MKNIFEVADTLVKHIQDHYKEDVAIIAYYGSYADGTATKRSDLDFFFIPATPEGIGASLQFVLHNISFDFWPISWERAERMASFEEPQTTIIANCELLYVRTEEDRARFLALREKISHMPQQGLKLADKAESLLRDANVHVYNMSQLDDTSHLTVYRLEAYEVMTKALQSLALLNRTYFTKGWGKNIAQIMQLPLKPVDLEAQMEQIMTAAVPSEILAGCQQLTEGIRSLLAEQRKEFWSAPAYAERISGFYEELKGVLDKVLTACENHNYDLAFFAALGAQTEIAHALYYADHGCWPSLSSEAGAHYNKLGLPDLVTLLDPNHFGPLYEAVERLDAQLENHLKANGVAINRFDGITDLEQFLNNRASIIGGSSLS